MLYLTTIYIYLYIYVYNVTIYFYIIIPSLTDYEKLLLSARNGISIRLHNSVGLWR